MDKPKFEHVELVAVELGFREGTMVKRGEKFRFTGNRLPKWAVPVASAAEALARTQPKTGDTRPAAVVAAVNRKTGSIGGLA